MIKIINFSSYQSYKDRNPPWIRLHKKLLDNYEYQSMSANARALLPMLWLLASEDRDPVSGMLRKSYEQIAFRLRMDINDVINGVDECEGKGFVEELHDHAENEKHADKSTCNKTVTEKLRNGHESVTPETETETYKDMCNSGELHARLPARKSKKPTVYTPEFEAFWDVYPRCIGKLEAFKAFLRVAKTYPPEDLALAAKEYASECERNKTEDRFIKHPRTFLNEDRWKDYCFEEVPNA
jgi:hypothetical protein